MIEIVIGLIVVFLIIGMMPHTTIRDERKDDEL